MFGLTGTRDQVNTELFYFCREALATNISTILFNSNGIQSIVSVFQINHTQAFHLLWWYSHTQSLFALDTTILSKRKFNPQIAMIMAMNISALTVLPHPLQHTIATSQPTASKYYIMIHKKAIIA